MKQQHQFYSMSCFEFAQFFVSLEKRKKFFIRDLTNCELNVFDGCYMKYLLHLNEPGSLYRFGFPPLEIGTGFMGIHMELFTHSGTNLENMKQMRER